MEWNEFHTTNSRSTRATMAEIATPTLVSPFVNVRGSYSHRAARLTGSSCATAARRSVISRSGLFPQCDRQPRRAVGPKHRYRLALISGRERGASESLDEDLDRDPAFEAGERRARANVWPTAEPRGDRERSARRDGSRQD